MIKAQINNGEFKIFNNIPNIAAIELHYKGSVYITPTLPEGWFLRAGKNKIIIANLGINSLSENTLFKFEGKLNINVSFAITKTLKKHFIYIKKTKRNWNNSYFLGSEIDKLNENWETIKSTNISKPKTNLTFQNNSSYNINKENKPIVNLPKQNNFYTKGNEYTLNGKNYIGYYHIHTDVNVAMTGRRHTKSSAMLQKTLREEIKQNTRKIREISRNTGGY